ncbi:SDR family NAD(P)-dependent oxidoreductase [Leptospira ognonensis]|uniref:SDR family NAD(P)-dependent oxidoreductase n=1 Tax=Leptospira ognonensis TaxID=2484945 RepID=A0A4R9K2R8_9LEPT|nr:SDR family NAD(P)-dependent oxidoreductase [Leptospira ognonensis]TGL60323.1 SDR family NAD(P)-dependent oxidoreductase [Leptospira ognonensis]
MDLKGKSILVTGAGMGIGALICKELAKAGADQIIGIDVLKESMRETENSTKALGCKFIGLACDLSREDHIESLIKQIKAEKLTFQVLVNNAGIAPSGPFSEQDFSVWKKAVQINVLGVIKLTHASLPILTSHPISHIVNLASIAGKFGSEGTVVYSATKHAIVGFSNALRMEYYEKNLGVSWICPSMVKTRMIDGVKPSLFTPVIEPILVAKAVKKAIEKNKAEVMVPGYVRLSIVILPTLFPRLFMWLAVKTKASRGWLLANKGLEKNIPV